MFFFFKQKTAYEMRISDWSSDVCSSDLDEPVAGATVGAQDHRAATLEHRSALAIDIRPLGLGRAPDHGVIGAVRAPAAEIERREQVMEIPAPDDERRLDRIGHRSPRDRAWLGAAGRRSEEDTSELQSLM